MGTKLERKSEGKNSDIVAKTDVDVSQENVGCGSALANMWVKENKKKQLVWLKDNNIVF